MQKLGQQNQYDPQTQSTHSNGGLTVAHTDVRSVRNDTATVDVCYTYAHSWYVDIQHTQQAPGAAEVTAKIIDVNGTWYLHGIANDHVVADCGR